jgi:GTP1/Obg family GTP-binding protein
VSTELLNTDLFDRLGKLASLFVWRRKSLRDAIVEDLRTANACHERLVRVHQDTLQHLQIQTQKSEELTKRLSTTDANLGQALIRLDTMAASYDKLRGERNALELACQSFEQRLGEARSELDEKSAILDTVYRAIAQKHSDHQQLTDEFNLLKKQNGDLRTRYQLISKLITETTPENSGQTRIRQLLENDYVAFTASERSLGLGVNTLLMLQSVEQELSLLVSLPDALKRTIVSIVGGFSSGKSEFINSFILDHGVRLPVGLQPVTAIPSYILASDERLIRGYSTNGGYVELDPDFYNGISHAYIDSFSFNLKNVMPFMCIETQMNNYYFSNICLIDTPGYNAPTAAGKYSENDKRTAVQFAQQSEAIVWLIGLDSNGTVPDSDLEYIQEIGLEGRSIYVVLNKADLKSDEEIQSIINEVKCTLNYENIAISGVSAYSSTQRKVIAQLGLPLMDYFHQINQPRDVGKILEERLKAVFDIHQDACQKSVSAYTQLTHAINGLKLDALEIGGVELYEKMLETISKLDKTFDTDPLKKSQNNSRRLLESFTEAIQQTLTYDRQMDCSPP